MVTPEKAAVETNGVFTGVTTYYGLSTDEKPTIGVGNGSCFIEMNIEMDTVAAYFYDADGQRWLPV